MSQPNDLDHQTIATDLASATIYPQGAHLTHWQPAGRKPVLWMSAKSRFELGAPIRGGIPICWPWFGPHPVNPEKPAHGFLRTMPWRLVDSINLADGSVRVTYEAQSDEMSQQLWPHKFLAELTATIGPTLTVALTVFNTCVKPFESTGALHTYFAVSDVTKVKVHGLDGVEYLDKVDGMKRKTQHGPVTISNETDRVYLNTESECVIEDPGFRRRIRIAKSGSKTTVVWNPWIEKSKKMSDFGDDEYPHMICVETAAAGDESIKLDPGASHRLEARISVQAI
ncbi:MAG: D-hexose-6-phosphate mutarotase [Planctomycetes bacterium]|nr:D-hexose-6-phosphate mutarotase [Planctomycetota bacterium]